MPIESGRAGVRRAVVIGVAVALAASMSWVAPADAGKKKKKRVERTAQEDYLGATGFRGVQDSPCAGEPVGCVIFEIEEGEKFVAIEIDDAAGGPVWASVYVYGYTDGTDFHEHVCGSSEGPFKLQKGLTELVVITTQTTGGATNPCDGPATSGTVTATFSNIR